MVMGSSLPHDHKNINSVNRPYVPKRDLDDCIVGRFRDEDA